MNLRPRNSGPTPGKQEHTPKSQSPNAIAPSSPCYVKAWMFRARSPFVGACWSLSRGI